ncbi:MAG TPA: ATP-binding protein [Geminicoccaceae bacterium]|nr:ATP-binding protein [Geminicoccaceae bacterium]
MSAVWKVLRHLWPRRLAAQLITLLLLALILSQAASVLIFMDERRIAIRAAERKQILERTASIVRLIERTPPALHEQIVRTASTGYLRFWLADERAAEAQDAGQSDNHLQRRLKSLIDDGLVREVVVDLRDEDGFWRRDGDDDDEGAPDAGRIAPARAGEVTPDRDADERPRQRRHRHHGPSSLLISARLDDGRWLNAGMNVWAPSPRWALPALLSMGVMAVALSLIVILMVRRITRPMAQLAAAAESLGRGETVHPLLEQGPLDVRQTTRAFNQMHDRLQRFVQDRTRMLAAISHDLRTPITSLRLRAEFVEDDETRAKILETLDEMQRMTEATLAFAREEAAREDTRTVDLGALIESLCEDLAEMGLEVAFAGAPRTPYPCRPVSLKRAIRNLVENAVAYGERARVALEPATDAFRIVIDDDGPGIPQADFERVFAPFVRLEESRSKETGGIGLGMAIARSIVRSHGGDITLANRPGGGLRATIHLPRADPK